MTLTWAFGDWVFLLTSIFEMMFFCGIMTGWSSLVYVLVEEGIYSHLCAETTAEISNGSLQSVAVNVTNNCLAQQEMLNLAYTLATSVSTLAAFPIGIAIDSFGPRVVRIVCGIFLAFSCFLFSFLNKSTPELLFPSLFVGCIGSLAIYMTPQTCTNRFKKGHSVVVGIYCGAWVTSALVFLGFKIIYEQGGVRFAHFFRFLAVSCIFLCINAALLYPGKLPAHDQDETCNDKQRQRKIAKGKTLRKISEFTLDKCMSCVRLTEESTSKNQNDCSANGRCSERNMLLPEEDKEFGSSPTKAFSRDTLNHTASHLYNQRKSGDLAKTTKSSACFHVNTNPDCLKISASCASFDKGQAIRSGDESDHGCKLKKLKTSRSEGLQPWTARSAEAYLRSGLSYKHCVFSAVHIWGEIFILVCKIRTWFYVGTFSNHILELSGGDRETEALYINIFGLSQIGALVFAPLFGLVIDRQSRRRATEHVSPSADNAKAHQKFMMGIEDSTKAVEFIIKCNRDKIYQLNDAVLVTACTAVIFCLMTLIPSLPVQIITFQMFTFLKVSYNALYTSTLITIFPAQHLGKLMGLASLLGSIFSLVQYPLFIVMEVCFDGRMLEVNIALWLSCMLTFGLPIYLWRKASQEEPDSLALVAV